MLTSETVSELQAPLSEASPCGDDLEYDPDFSALESAAQGKAEQQFGDTVIPAVEPDWPQVDQLAQSLLKRTKDVRPAVLLLRAATRQQGLAGFELGMGLLTDLLDAHWGCIHPQLDASDNNDATMRINALAPLADESLLVRDLYDAWIGTSRSVGPIRVRDVAVARNALAPPASGGYSAAQVQGGLEEILASDPAVAERLRAVTPLATRLQNLVGERTEHAAVLDLSRLRAMGALLLQAAQAAAGTSNAEDSSEAGEASADASTGGGGGRGAIASRQDALQMLDRVIRYLEVTEPGNPAPLLIERAKKLIGVSFLEIIENLAPHAMDAIATVTGRRSNE